MRVIDTSNWGEFPIDELFDVVKGSRLTKSRMRLGETRHIGASQFDNGVTSMIGNDESLHPGSVLTVCYDGPVGTTFYQAERFWATDAVNVLYPKFNLNEAVALFLIPVLQNAGSAFNYGQKWGAEVMRATVIRLPVISSGEPDWVYMEQTMRKVMARQSRALDVLASASATPVTEIKTSSWKSFMMADIFEMTNTKSITAADLVPDSGQVPYVTSQEGNNGVQMYVDCPNEWLDLGGCIMIGGKTLSFSYQEQDFCSNDSHNIALYSKDPRSKSENCQLFLISVLRASLGSTYSWGDSISMKRVKDESFMLPVTVDGDPDWEYMEQSMHKVMAERTLALSILHALVSEV